MLLWYLYKGGTTIKESKGIPIMKVRMVTSRGKGGGHDLRGVYTGAGNLLFFNLCGTYMTVYFIIIHWTIYMIYAIFCMYALSQQKM